MKKAYEVLATYLQPIEGGAILYAEDENEARELAAQLLSNRTGVKIVQVNELPQEDKEESIEEVPPKILLN